MNASKRTAKLYQVGKKTGKWVKAASYTGRTVRKFYNLIVRGQ